MLDAFQEKLVCFFALVGVLEHFLVDLLEFPRASVVGHCNLYTFRTSIIFVKVEAEFKWFKFFVDSLVVVKEDMC